MQWHAARAEDARARAAHAQLVKRSHDLNAKDLLPQIIAIAKSAAALRDHFKGGTSEAAKN